MAIKEKLWFVFAVKWWWSQWSSARWKQSRQTMFVIELILFVTRCRCFASNHTFFRRLTSFCRWFFRWFATWCRLSVFNLRIVLAWASRSGRNHCRFVDRFVCVRRSFVLQFIPWRQFLFAAVFQFLMQGKCGFSTVRSCATCRATHKRSLEFWLSSANSFLLANSWFHWSKSVHFQKCEGKRGKKCVV